jgi:hypothetical protein
MNRFFAKDDMPAADFVIQICRDAFQVVLSPAPFEVKTSRAWDSRERWSRSF